MPPVLRFLFCLILTAVALASCHPQGERSVRVTVIGEPEGLFRPGAATFASRLLRSATSEGLVSFDAEGHVVPALADRWIVTDDGQSYIFRLRKGAWGNVTNPGEPARAALRQAIAAQRGTALGIDLAAIDEIRAMAGRVIEIRLSRPVPDLLQLLALPELGLRRGGEQSPMTMRRKGAEALLAPLPPERRGLPAVEGWKKQAREVHLRAGNAQAALADFAAGRIDLVLGGTFADFPRSGRFVLGRNRPRLDPVTGLFGLQVMRTQGLLARPDVREALAMAIDRDALASALAVPGWTTTTRVVAPGAEGDVGLVSQRWDGMNQAQRQLAASRVIAAHASGQAGKLTIALPAGPGADVLFARLQTDFSVLAIQLARVPQGDPADLRLVDLVARSARPEWFLARLACPVVRGPCSEAADSLATAAADASDPATAASLTARAEITLLNANTYIPLGVPVRWSLAPADGAGFAPNRWGIHPLMALATAGT